MGIDVSSLAKEAGFSVAEPMDPSTLQFLPEVRSMCSADRCRSYNRSWACPPACGELSAWEKKCSQYCSGLILQLIADREDSYDFEAMEAAGVLCRQIGEQYVEALRRSGLDFLFLSAGTCSRCKTCTYPDAPCRFPELLFPSMEACGLFVSQVCKDNGVPYYYGDDKIAFTCCLLYNE